MWLKFVLLQITEKKPVSAFDGVLYAVYRCSWKHICIASYLFIIFYFKVKLHKYIFNTDRNKLLYGNIKVKAFSFSLRCLYVTSGANIFFSKGFGKQFIILILWKIRVTNWFFFFSSISFKNYAHTDTFTLKGF